MDGVLDKTMRLENAMIVKDSGEKCNQSGVHILVYQDHHGWRPPHCADGAV